MFDSCCFFTWLILFTMFISYLLLYFYVWINISLLGYILWKQTLLNMNNLQI